MNTIMSDLIERLRQADKEIAAAVDRQWDGDCALNLSIPADEERDTDLVISKALRDAEAEITRLRVALREMCVCPNAVERTRILGRALNDKP